MAAAGRSIRAARFGGISRGGSVNPQPTSADGAAPLDPRALPLLAALPQGVLLFDRQLDIVHENAAARGGASGEKRLPAALAALVAGVAAPAWESDLRDVLATGRTRRFDGLPLQSPGGERVANLLIAPLGNAEKQAAGVVLIEDVSARRALEQRLATSERLAAVGKLCATVAHELNNPLDGILRFLNLALRVAEPPADPRIVQYVSQARDGVMRLVQIVRALLEFSRSAPPRIAPQDVFQLIEEAIRTLEGKAAAGSVAIVCHFQQTELPALAGANLFQVFCNLIQNAIDAMPQGGTLTIRGGLEAGELVIHFEDTGAGLPAQAERLFEPFFTTKAPGKGTGLGLAVSREIVERCGGRLSAGNRRDRQGAVFTLRFALRTGGGLNADLAADGTNPAPSPASPTPVDTKGTP